ncbi:hypothetical protein [Microscilla marina]|nr:hypothetical protein [Microscilla marina]
MDKVELLLENTPPHIKGVKANDLIILNIVGEDVHYWSPQLNLRIAPDEDDEQQTKVSGLIGPRPAVWTLFMFIYFAVGTLGLFISSFAFSKILMGGSSSLIAVFPLTIVFLLTAYGVGKYGEKLAKDQVELLKDFVREVVDGQKSTVDG